MSISDIWMLRSIEQNKIKLRPSTDPNYDPFQITANYCKKNNCFKDGNVKITYTQKRPFGGRFCTQGPSLQNIPHEVRNTFCRDTYYDIDIVNSQPTI